MGERGVRNAEVEGSNPLPSTILISAVIAAKRLVRALERRARGHTVTT